MSGLNDALAPNHTHRPATLQRAGFLPRTGPTRPRRSPAKSPVSLIFDVVCVSHLRWKFVVQRPQHLLRRFAADRRVLFIEEPEFGDAADHMRIEAIDGIILITPQLQHGAQFTSHEDRVRTLVTATLREHQVADYVLWYYTPMALGFTQQLNPRLIVWDCMDELSAFAFAPKELREREAELLRRAHVVFTGGVSLYEAKRDRHHNVHPFPSSIDQAHFAQARAATQEPADQAAIPHPRIGFCGVVDERFDIELLRASARLKPDWQWVIIGPVVKIDPSSLPQAPNIHYLGKKNYSELPGYMAGWDAAMLPFARNESTRFISPTKTPEYLAAGLPVVSTSITDVIRPYADLKLVKIADEPADFVAQIAAAIAEKDEQWLARVDQHLALGSWDKTLMQMKTLIHEALVAKESVTPERTTATPQLI